MSSMNDLQTVPYVIAYDEKDCIGFALPELIQDIGESVKKRLVNEIKNKPLKCNVTITFNSIIEEEPYGDNDSKSLG